MTRVLPLYADHTLQVAAGEVEIRPGVIYDDASVRIEGEPADLIRLSDALRQAALRAIDAKVAAAREVAS